MSDVVAPYLIAQDRWLLWRGVPRTNKAGETIITKVPIAYRTGKPCDAHDPRNWVDHARIIAAITRTPGAWDGPGFDLGEITDQGEIVIGLDLDSCLNAESGLAAWAIDYLTVLHSYAEVSPSGTGVKVFARIALADLPEARRLLDVADGEKEQARTRTFGERVNGATHVPGAQLFLTRRYFAVTGKHWAPSPNDVALLTLEQVARLAALFGPRERPGPRQRAKANGADNDTTPSDQDLQAKLALELDYNFRLKARWEGDTEGLADTSRSGFDMSVVGMLKAAGWTKGECRAALERFKHGKVTEEPERYFARMWERALGTPLPQPDAVMGEEPEEEIPEPETPKPEPEPSDSGIGEDDPSPQAEAEPQPEPKQEQPKAQKKSGRRRVDTPAVLAMVTAFNNKFFVLNEQGKALIYAPKHDPQMNRRFYERISFADLEKLYLNRTIQVGVTAKGEPEFAQVAPLWLRHRLRKQYIGGVVFDPSGREHPADVLNLWQGFAVKSDPSGSWALLKEHVLTIICNGEAEAFNYLLDWMADVVQRPDRQGEVAAVLRGGEGSGKGILARALLYLLGQHGFAISNAKHLTGNFNAHLRDCVLLFADEALYAGDKAHVGILKSIITEPYLTVEGKFQNAVMARNYLHLILASNENWVVPASLESRRFYVRDVSNARANDHAYFAAILSQLEQGGYSAMLHELLARDLSKSNLRAVPVTQALVTQRTLSLGTTEAWWLDCLHRGYVFASRLGLEEVFAQWHEVISTDLLFASYQEFGKGRRHDRQQLNRPHFGKWLQTMAGCTPSRPRGMIVVGEHMADIVTKDTDPAFGSTVRRGAAPVMRERAHSYQVGSLNTAREAFTAATKLQIEWPQDQNADTQETDIQDN